MTREEEAEAVLDALREPRWRIARWDGMVNYGPGHYRVKLGCGHLKIVSLEWNLPWPMKVDCKECE